MSESSFSKNSLLYSLTSYGNLFILLMANVVIAKTLGPSGKGALSLIVLIIFFIYYLISLGMERATVYYLGTAKDRQLQIINNATIFSLAIGSAAGFLVWALRDAIGAAFSLDEYRLAIGISALYIPVFLLKLNYLHVMLGLKRFTVRNVAAFADVAFYFVSVIIFVYLLRLGVAGGVMAHITGCVLSIVIVAEHLRKSGMLPRPDLDPALLRESVLYGIKSQAGNIMHYFAYKLDMFLVNFFLGIASVGIYSIAVSIAQILWHFPDAVGNVLFPTVCENGNERSHAFIASTSRKTLLLTSLGAAAIAVNAWWFVPIFFGEQFLPSVKPLLLLLPGIMALGVYRVLIFGLMGKGHPHYMSYAGTVSLTITLALDILLIPRYGVPGAAFASTVAYILCAAFTIIWFRKISGLAFAEILLPGKDDIQFLVRKIKSVFTNGE